MSFRFPWHKYLGPGNKLTEGAALDFDDYLAYLHDIEYEKNNIYGSDKHFANDFLTDFLNSNNPHSLFGFLGLSGKYLFEEKFGQVYPMPPKKNRYGKTTGELHRGQRLYADRQRQLGRDYQLARQRGFTGNWHDWLRSQGNRTTGVPPIEAVTPSRTPNQVGRPPRAGTSHDDFGDFEGENPVLEELSDIIQDIGHIFDESMHMEQDVIDPTADPHSSSGGGGVANAIGNIETATKYLNIPRSVGMKDVTLTFRKSRIFYTYGYAFQQITTKKTNNTVDLGDLLELCTPFSTLPADMLGFYIDLSEFKILNGSVKVLNANITVVPQGLRTAFDYGTTLTGTATSEHVSIGCSGIGLNKKVYSRHGTYTSEAASPMKPTGVNDFNGETFIKKLYGTNNFDAEQLGMNLGIPRHVNMYFVLVSNSSRELPAPNTNKYQRNICGWPAIDKMYDRWSFMPKIGEIVIDYNYKPVNGVIGLKRHYLPYAVDTGDVAWATTPHFLASKIAIKNQYDATRKDTTPVIAPDVSKKSYINVNYYDQPYTMDMLYSSIDPVKMYHPHSTKQCQTTIPLPYFGILPVPQLNPAQDTTQFQNSCAYWSVKCELTLTINTESLYSQGHMFVASPDEAAFKLDSAVEGCNYNNFYPMNLITYGN